MSLKPQIRRKNHDPNHTGQLTTLPQFYLERRTKDPRSSESQSIRCTGFRPPYELVSLHRIDEYRLKVRDGDWSRWHAINLAPERRRVHDCPKNSRFVGFWGRPSKWKLAKFGVLYEIPKSDAATLTGSCVLFPRFRESTHPDFSSLEYLDSGLD